MNRVEKWTLAIAVLSIIISTIGTYESLSIAGQAASAANEAVSIERRSYEVANNYSYVEISSTTPLELRPRACEPNGSSSNVSCSFVGTFNVSFTIIAPHAGTYNVTILGIIGMGPFSPHPVHYSDGSVVKIGNVTISTYPALKSDSAIQGGVPISSSLPFKETTEIEVSGFTLEAPSSSIGNLNFQGEGKVLAMLTFSDLQERGNYVQRLFIVQVYFLP